MGGGTVVGRELPGDPGPEKAGPPLEDPCPAGGYRPGGQEEGGPETQGLALDTVSCL